VCLPSRFGAEKFVNLTYKVVSGKLDLVDNLKGGKSRKFPVLFKIFGKQQTLKTMHAIELLSRLFIWSWTWDNILSPNTEFSIYCICNLPTL